MAGVLYTRELTRVRIALALLIAIVTDATQFLLGVLGPVGWGVDDGADVVAMVLLTMVLGFHPLFLPTFVVELLPVADMLPTWTGCVLMVVMLRRRSTAPKPPPPSHPQPPVIDI